MAWKETDVLEQRTLFIARYRQQTDSMTALCQEFGISRPTGYLWVRRFAADGPSGLHDHCSAPQTHPNAIPEVLVDRIVTLRDAHPAWGARKLRAALQRQDSTVVWPAPSTITAILDREGRLHRRPWRRPAPTATPSGPRTDAHAPNDVWCLDFKGWFPLTSDAPCYPFTLSDQASRFLLRCHALPSQEGAGVQPVLAAAFREFGLPRVIRSDNGTPFASTGLGGLSRLSLWWLKLGIRHERISPGCPQQNGRHERLHRTMDDEGACQPTASHRAQHRVFQTFRRTYNYDRPHEALGGAVPADLYTPSGRPYRAVLPPLTYPADFTPRLVRPNGCLKWHGRDLFVSEVLIGEQVALEPLTLRHWALHVGPLILAVLDDATGRWVARREAAHLLALCERALDDGLPLPAPAGPGASGSTLP